MTHEDVFLQDIIDNHEDDTPRRIYADWLLDHPDPVCAARGEFIHIQCNLARQPIGGSRPEALVKRERELLETHGREWGNLFRRLGCRCWEYRRGFVEGVGLSASSFLSQAAALFRAAPLREVKLYEAGARLADVAGCGWLGRVRILDLEKNDLGDADLETLARSAHLRSLERLLLWSNRISNTGLYALGHATAPLLDSIDLSSNIIGDDGLQRFLGTPLFARLRRLDLHSNQIGDAGASSLLSEPTMQLLWLDISKNPLGAAMQTRLRQHFAGRVELWG